MSDSEKLVHRAIDLSEDEDYDNAVDLLTRAINSDSRNVQAYFERGLALFNLDKNADAIADFDRDLALEEGYPGAHEWRARVLKSLEDYQQAAEARLKSLRANPEGPYEGFGVIPQAWADCAESFIAAGDHTMALGLLEEYFRDQISKVERYINSETAPMRMFSKLLIQSGDYDRACKYSKKAYTSKYQRPADIFYHALALEASGKLKEARKICDEAMQINNQMPGLKELQQRLTKRE